VDPQSAKSAALLEVNCETDFVSRGDVFRGFVSNTRDLLVSSSQAPVPSPSSLFGDVSVSEWVETSLASAEAGAGPETLKERIITTIGKVGENIKIRRAIKSSSPLSSSSEAQVFYGGYAHGSGDGMGRLAALVALQVSSKSSPLSSEASTEAQKLSKQIAQQVVGFAPTVVDESELPAGSPAEDLDSVVLLRQGFLMGGGTVAEVVKAFGDKFGVEARVVEFKRYELGEGIVKEEGDFAAEVLKAAGIA
jgi:elongation factor Ts